MSYRRPEKKRANLVLQITAIEPELAKKLMELEPTFIGCQYLGFSFSEYSRTALTFSKLGSLFTTPLQDQLFFNEVDPSQFADIISSYYLKTYPSKFSKTVQMIKPTKAIQLFLLDHLNSVNAYSLRESIRQHCPLEASFYGES